MSALSIALTGFITAVSLIVTIGPQNAYLLRFAVQRLYVVPLVLICISGEFVLVLGSIAGVGAIVSAFPWLLTGLAWLGAAFLTWYGISSIVGVVRTVRSDRRSVASKGEPDVPALAAPALIAPGPADAAVLGASGVGLATAVTAPPTAVVSSRRALGVMAAITYLNPHAYMDTVVVLGGVANTYGESLRWAYGGGAVLAGVAFFIALAVAARAMTALFDRPRTWLVLDTLTGIMMLIVAGRLLISSLA